MTDLKTRLVAHPTEDDHNAILAPLLAYNMSVTGDDWYKPLAILLHDDKEQVQGGLWAKCYYDWLFVELLFVPEVARGQDLGSSLLRQAEDWARNEACIGVWLDTFSFQAPDFYRKQGYSVFGTVEDYPKGHQRVFLRKLF